jgi:hypothetical protein
VNLRGIVAGYTAAINPWITGSYQQSTGYTQAADGTQLPTYATAVPLSIQKQPLTFKDLHQISGLNLNGEKAAFYVNGNLQGVQRVSARGGDLITLPSGDVWLVVMLLENWSETSGWGKVAVVLQNGS